MPDAKRRAVEQLPPAPNAADLAECSRRRITYVQLLAERNGVPDGKTFTVLPCTVPAQRYTLPWSALQTGNRFFGLASKAYVAAKERARDLVKLDWPGMLYTVPVSLRVTLYAPNDQRRDVLNYAKLIADVLTGIVYRDDSLIHEAHFTRALDVDRPRAEITVTPLTQPTP